MAVNVTPNIGLQKPTGDEIARAWASETGLAELAEDNNLAFTNAIPNDVLYIPELWAGSGTAGTQGTMGTTGAVTNGRWIRLPGDFIMGYFVLIAGSGVTIPAGDSIAITLPFDIDDTFHAVNTSFNGLAGIENIGGEGFLRENSNVATSMQFALGLSVISGVSYVRPLTESYAGKTQRFITATSPMAAWETGDSLTGNFIYKGAP